MTIVSCRHSHSLYTVRQDFLDKKEHERIAKNQIKTITTFMYDYKNGSFENEGYKNYEEFDINGHLIKDALYDPKGKLKNLVTYSYNAKGIQTSRKSQQYSDDGSVSNASETIYNSFGQPVKMLHYRKTELDRINIYSYDRKGRLIKDESTIPNDTVEYINTYVYNKKNLLIEDLGITSEINDSGKRIYHTDRKYKFKYDEKGNETEMLLCQDNNVELTTYKSIYDEKGNLIEDYTYDDTDGKLSAKEIFTYDNNGNIIEINMYSSSGQVTIKTTYDENGNPIEEISHDKTSPLSKAIYKYDFHKD